jgi:hypothetical protein
MRARSRAEGEEQVFAAEAADFAMKDVYHAEELT